MTGIVDFRASLLDEYGNPITDANPLPTTGGGGGGGGVLSDTVFVDGTGQLFVYRDTGSGTPNAYAIPAWTLYTPSGTVTSASSGNAAASATGSPVPGSADYVGFNSGGNLVGVSASNPLPVSGSVTVTNFPATQNVNIVGGSSGNAAAGTTGAAVPASADYIGFNSGGNLVGVSSSNPLPVDIGAVGVLEVTDSDSQLLLTRMLNYLNSPQGYDKSLQALRITGTLPTVTTVGTVTTVTTVTTCSTVTNLSTIDTLQGRIQVYGANLSAWADCVRSRIT
jgi:hypothetical protein